MTNINKLSTQMLTIIRVYAVKMCTCVMFKNDNNNESVPHNM